GATKIALGHHLDDAVETLFLNMFQGGRMKTMPPKLKSDDGRHVVIRPLYYVRETLLERFATQQSYPIIPCNLCGSQENLMRVQLKALLRSWDRDHPGRVENIARAMSAVTPSHLADPALYDFAGLQPDDTLLPLLDLG
ncbi:MAG: ATP-binding protein, partial [Pseudomonadota bacterium]